MKRIIILMVLVAFIGMGYQAAFTRETEIKIYNRNYEYEMKVEGNRALDKNYKAKYHLEGNKIYDRNYRYQGKIEGDKVYDKDYRLKYHLKK